MESNYSTEANLPLYELQHPLTPEEFDSMMHAARIASEFMRKEFQRLADEQTEKRK